MLNSNTSRFKTLLVLLFGMGFLLVGATGVWATPLPLDNAGTTVTYSNATEWVSFDGGTTYGNYYTEYTLTTTTNDLGSMTAFCVEDANLNNSYSYELIDLPDYQYLDAAAILASHYFAEPNAYTQETMQLAIWESVFDYGGYDLGGGSFIIQDAGRRGEVAALLANLTGLDAWDTIISDISLAHSPAGSVGDLGGISQDYLVGVSVPDASLFFLLSPALIGLGMLGRRRKC